MRAGTECASYHSRRPMTSGLPTSKLRLLGWREDHVADTAPVGSGQAREVIPAALGRGWFCHTANRRLARRPWNQLQAINPPTGD